MSVLATPTAGAIAPRAVSSESSIPDRLLDDPRVRRARLTDGIVTWGYDDLKQTVQEWCDCFTAVRARVVAIELDNSLEWAAIAIALLDSDRVAVPIPGFFTAEQKQHALRDAGVDCVVQAAATGNSTAFRSLHVQPCACESRPLPAGTALVTYTSGSTGNPKGACLSRATVLATANSLVTELAPLNIRRHLSVLPLSLLLENVAGLYANLLNGSEIALHSLTSMGIHGSANITLPELLGTIERVRPHSLIVVPGILLALTAAAEFGASLPDDLVYVAVGGAKVPAQLLRRAHEQGLPAYEGYGLTECGSVITINTPAHQRSSSVGRLLGHVETAVVDGELLVLQPRFLGYTGEDDTDKLARAPFVATGDLVSIDEDDFVYIHGRKKSLFINAFGRNVSPEWPESELVSELPISFAVVMGEGATTASALVEGLPGFDEATIHDAVQRANSRLPDYAAVSAVRILPPGSLLEANALTGNGRVKRDVAIAAFCHPDQTGASKASISTKESQ